MEKRRRDRAQASLEEMLELLSPYLPKRVFVEEDSGSNWEIADLATPAEHEKATEQAG